jgi:hypothetical protein
MCDQGLIRYIWVEHPSFARSHSSQRIILLTLGLTRQLLRKVNTTPMIRVLLSKSTLTPTIERTLTKIPEKLALEKRIAGIKLLKRGRHSPLLTNIRSIVRASVDRSIGF